LEKANLDVWARDLPDGLDTQIMSGASKISGGQKQRIGLARSFYTDADFLILDEATSALDENTEQAILETLDQQLDGKTSVAIAHRLSTLKSCSRIIEMSNGEVVFDGSWVEFSKHRGL
jgi:ABC-type multidrug transport system fused ATPase/permease subunit